MSIFVGEPRRMQIDAGRVSMLKQTKRNGTVTRQDLRAVVYECRPGLSRAEAQMLLDETLEEISAALIRGESVSLRSFGTFNVRTKRERIGRNPKNGVEARICARRVISFRASPVLVARVNGEPPPESSD